MVFFFFIRLAVGSVSQKFKRHRSRRHAIKLKNHLHPKHDLNWNNHEKGKVLCAPKKTTAISNRNWLSHSLHLEKKINRASAQPAQGPSLKPRSLGKSVSLCFAVCGQLAGQGARGERPRWKEIRDTGMYQPVRARSTQRWTLADAPKPTESGRRR